MSFREYKPEWLYEALPYLYVVSGFATFLVLRNEIAVFSGLMLLSAGAAVWFMRKKHRESDRDVPRLANERSTPTSTRGFVELVWRRGYECGHPIIDAQHRGLFASGNELFDAILTNLPKREVERLLDELACDVEHHFQTEESILAVSDRGFAEAHKNVHRQLLEKANTLCTQYREGKVAAGELISFVVYDVVAQHIAKEDKDCFPHVKLG
jgi:hemerythrin-like metal-binding protein